jgi:hypothetical protein
LAFTSPPDSAVNGGRAVRAPDAAGEGRPTQVAAGVGQTHAVVACHRPAGSGRRHRPLRNHAADGRRLPAGRPGLIRPPGSLRKRPIRKRPVPQRLRRFDRRAGGRPPPCEVGRWSGKPRGGQLPPSSGARAPAQAAAQPQCRCPPASRRQAGLDSSAWLFSGRGPNPDAAGSGAQRATPLRSAPGPAAGRRRVKSNHTRSSASTVHRLRTLPQAAAQPRCRWSARLQPGPASIRRLPVLP